MITKKNKWPNSKKMSKWLEGTALWHAIRCTHLQPVTVACVFACVHVALQFCASNRCPVLPSEQTAASSCSLAGFVEPGCFQSNNSVSWCAYVCVSYTRWMLLPLVSFLPTWAQFSPWRCLWDYLTAGVSIRKEDIRYNLVVIRDWRPGVCLRKNAPILSHTHNAHTLLHLQMKLIC